MFYKLFEALLINYGEMQSIRIPALRGAGAARLGALETIVSPRFPTFPGAPPVNPWQSAAAVGGGSGGMQTVRVSKVFVS